MPAIAGQSKLNKTGSLCNDLPDYVRNPPIEAVAFSWGVAEDGQLIAGSRSTMIIEDNGEVLSWGWNARGTLGQGSKCGACRMHTSTYNTICTRSNVVPKPKPVAGLDGVHIIQGAVGGWHAMLLDANGRAWAMGGNEYGQCGCDPQQRDVLVPRPCVPHLTVAQVACGGMHSLVLTTTGEVWMWGEIWGDFSMTADRAPRRVHGARDVVQIKCGAFHNLALDCRGAVFAWGINDFGQLGTGDTSYATTPQQVVGLDDVFVSDVEAGGWHSLAISDTGAVYVWGRGEYGRLGLGDKGGASKLRPTRVTSLDSHRVVHASCGGTHTMVLTADSRLFVWGRGSFGRLGTGGVREAYQPQEVQLPGGPDRWRIVDVAAGGRHSLVLAVPDNGSLKKAQSVAGSIDNPAAASRWDGRTQHDERVDTDLEGSPARRRHHSPDSDQGSDAHKSPPHGEGSMGDDELDDLQSPGYDSEAPVAAVGSPYLGMHYTGPPAEPAAQQEGSAEVDAQSAAQPSVVANPSDVPEDSVLHGHPLPSHALTQEALLSVVSQDSAQAYRRNDTLDSLELSDEIYRRSSSIDVDMQATYSGSAALKVHLNHDLSGPSDD